MSSPLDLARPDLRALRPYQPGAWEPGLTRLNANESPWRLDTDPTERGLNVYPPPRPYQLREALARYYETTPDRVLVTRGSSEAIDVLIRGFCRAGIDSILTTPPSFDMYRVYATIQGAGMQYAPLDSEAGYAFDMDGLRLAMDASTRIVFVCSPNNPTGTVIGRENLAALAAAVEGRAILVIDAAYQEYAEDQGLNRLLERYDHVVVLRTLSKFVALAGARCGALLGSAEVIQYLENVLPPYTFPTPSIEIVLAALSDRSLAVARERVGIIRSERERLSEALRRREDVSEVYPSEANFILARVRDRDSFVANARSGGVLIRTFSGEPSLADCVRITIGRPEDNDLLLSALGNGA